MVQFREEEKTEYRWYSVLLLHTNHKTQPWPRNFTTLILEIHTTRFMVNEFRYFRVKTRGLRIVVEQRRNRACHGTWVQTFPEIAGANKTKHLNQ